MVLKRFKTTCLNHNLTCMKLSRSLLKKIQCFPHEENTQRFGVRENVVYLRKGLSVLATKSKSFQPLSNVYISAILP